MNSQEQTYQQVEPISKAGFVYLIQAGDSYRFKIGCTSNLENRLSSLQSGSSLKLHLLGAIKSADMIATERAWHRLFSQNRAHGEWFDLGLTDFLKIARKFRAKFILPPSERVDESLEIGQRCFISLNGREAIEVSLLSITPKSAQIPHGEASVKEIHGRQTWRVFPDEVRSTPIGAIFNCMFILNNRYVRTRRS